MTTHDLKTWPVPFEATWTGAKVFEIRLNDRFYQRGDRVVLWEYDVHAACECASSGPHRPGLCAKYSGRSVAATIGFLTSNMPGRGGVRGFNAGDYVVLSLTDIQRHNGRPTPAPKPALVTPETLRRALGVKEPR